MVRGVVEVDKIRAAIESEPALLRAVAFAEDVAQSFTSGQAAEGGLAAGQGREGIVARSLGSIEAL